MSTTAILLMLFMAFLVLHYFIYYLIGLHNANQNTRAGVPFVRTAIEVKIKAVLFQVIFNLATVVGIAIIIKLMKHWWHKQKETAQVIKEKATAELQLLKAQVHPHFLFNSLNNIYSFTLEGSPKAPGMIQKLLNLLHYMLHECIQPLVPIETELRMINNYISLEIVRYGDRLKIDLQLPQSVDAQIAPLLLIPFVENSFKHGTSKMLEKPYILLSISILDNTLYFKLINSKPPGSEETVPHGTGGLGLKNVKKRLDLLYPATHELQLFNEPTTYTVLLKIILTQTIPGKLKELIKKETPVYERA